jgi:Tol biopolymer transport system component
MYLWEEGEKQAVKIYDVNDRICSLTWSPDGNYVLADAGTSPQRICYIVRREDKKSMARLAYAFRALWSPDSKKVALATQGDPLTGDASNYTDLDETLDLSIYDVETNSSTVIKKGEQESMRILDKWLDSKNIQYIKSYIRSDKRETLQCAVEN